MPRPDVGDRVRFTKSQLIARGKEVPVDATGTVTHCPAYGWGVELDAPIEVPHNLYPVEITGVELDTANVEIIE